MDIHTAIDTWIIGLKYNDKNKTIVSRLKNPGGPVLHTLAFKYWKPYYNFGTLSFYGTTRNEWSDRHSKKSSCGISNKLHFIKKHE